MTQDRILSWEDSDLWSTIKDDKVAIGGGDRPFRGEGRADKN